MAADFDATRELMADPTVIYLQPACCADEAVGRLWCEDDSPVDCEDGVPWTKYVRADEIERLRNSLAMAEAVIAGNGALITGLQAERDALLSSARDWLQRLQAASAWYEVAMVERDIAEATAADAARGKDDAA